MARFLMMKAVRRFLHFLGALLLLSAVGCGGPRLYPVTGTIEFTDGTVARELAGATVEFDPVQGKEGARGQVQPDGRFRMGTGQAGDGVAPGWYRVCIVPPLPDLDKGGVRRFLPRRYEDFKTSGLPVEVQPQDNQVKLSVERIRTKR